MDGQPQQGGHHSALASEPRRRVLELLMESTGPLDAAMVAADIGLHVTTARFHLEQLEAAGLIRRERERAGQRGRPRVLFTASPSTRAEGAERQLSQALAGALAEDADGGRARAIRAGEAWSAQFTPELLQATDAGTAPLVRILDRIGFDPELQADERTIALHACPFRDAARQNPSVVCSVHLGLIQGVAAALGHDVTDASLRPFVQPDLCVVDLLGSWPSGQDKRTGPQR